MAPGAAALALVVAADAAAGAAMVTMPSRIQAACRRCGSARLAAQIIAWADYDGGEFQAVDLSEAVALKPGGWAICHDCSEEQPIVEGEAAA